MCFPIYESNAGKPTKGDTKPKSTKDNGDGT